MAAFCRSCCVSCWPLKLPKQKGRNLDGFRPFFLPVVPAEAGTHTELAKPIQHGSPHPRGVISGNAGNDGHGGILPFVLRQLLAA